MIRGNEISSMTDGELISVITQLINLADEYYDSAIDGIKFIPIRSRFSIYMHYVYIRQLGIK